MYKFLQGPLSYPLDLRAVFRRNPIRKDVSNNECAAPWPFWRPAITFLPHSERAEEAFSLLRLTSVRTLSQPHRSKVSFKLEGILHESLQRAP